MSYNLDDVQRRSTIDPNDILKHSKMLLMLKYQQAKEENPKLTQDQLCSLIRTSKSTLYRSRTDIKMDSPHRYSIPMKHSRSTRKQEQVQGLHFTSQSSSLNNEPKKKVGRPSKTIRKVDVNGVQDRGHNEIGGSLNYEVSTMNDQSEVKDSTAEIYKHLNS